MTFDKYDKFNNSLNSDFENIIKDTSKLWKNLKNKNIFLTGCTGFFGYWILRTFVIANKKFKLNSKAYVLTRNKSFKKDKDALWVAIEAPQNLMRYVVTKGYITLDGTSLTVVDVGENWFNVTLVSYTQNHIVLPTKAVGDAVNIEVDVLGKYVENLLKHNTTNASTVDVNFLKENGYA